MGTYLTHQLNQFNSTASSQCSYRLPFALSSLRTAGSCRGICSRRGTTPATPAILPAARFRLLGGNFRFQVRDFAIRKLAFAVLRFSPQSLRVWSIRPASSFPSRLRSFATPATVRTFRSCRGPLRMAVCEDDQQIHDAVQKVTIMADDDHRAFKLADGLFERIAGPDIEMIRRFVEHENVHALTTSRARAARLRSPPLSSLHR